MRVHRLQPQAKRILLIKRGDWSSGHPVISGMALGRIDYHLFDPWAPLEQILYPSIGEFLAAWNTSQDAPIVAVRIVGHQQSARSHEVRDLLSRASVPYWFFSPETEAGRQVLAEAGEDGTRLPVLLFYSGSVLVDPSNADRGRGARDEQPASDHVLRRAGRRRRAGGTGRRGVRRFGGAAHHGGGTGDPRRPGRHQLADPQLSGLSSRCSGQDLAIRAIEQAWLFGVDFVLTQRATKVEMRGSDRIVHTTDGSAVAARAVVLATGVAWRRLNVPALEALVGAGVFYGGRRSRSSGHARPRCSSGRRRQLRRPGRCPSRPLCAVGHHAGARSGLAATMSSYLITEITSNPAISVRVRTEILDGDGSGGLETLTVVDHTTGRQSRVPAPRCSC